MLHFGETHQKLNDNLSSIEDIVKVYWNYVASSKDV